MLNRNTLGARNVLERAQNLTKSPAEGLSGAHGADPAPARRLFPFRALAVAAGLGAGFLFLASGEVRCAFASTFHLPCPACGSTRATLALLHGDLVGALHYNPAAPFIVAMLGALAARGVWLMAVDGHVERLGEGVLGRWALRLLVVFLILEVVIWAARFFGLFGGPVPV